MEITSTYSFSPVFFMLLTVKSFEILPKHTGYGCIYESFSLNWYIFTVLINKKLLLSLWWGLNRNLVLGLVKLTRYLASGAIVTSSSLDVHQELKLFSVINIHRRTIIISSNHFYLIHHLTMKNVNLHQIQHHNH